MLDNHNEQILFGSGENTNKNINGTSDFDKECSLLFRKTIFTSCIAVWLIFFLIPRLTKTKELAIINLAELTKAQEAKWEDRAIERAETLKNNLTSLTAIQQQDLQDIQTAHKSTMVALQQEIGVANMQLIEQQTANDAIESQQIYGIKQMSNDRKNILQSVDITNNKEILSAQETCDKKIQQATEKFKNEQILLREQLVKIKKNHQQT